VQCRVLVAELALFIPWTIRTLDRSYLV